MNNMFACNVYAAKIVIFYERVTLSGSFSNKNLVIVYVVSIGLRGLLECSLFSIFLPSFSLGQ